MDDATRSIQRAIDGGGRVRLEPGTHIVRTLHLRSGTTLEIPEGCTLLAHHENNAFDLQEKLPYQPWCDMETSDFAHALFVGRDIESVAIIGAGTIDMARTVRWGPKPIALRRCRYVRVEGVTITRAPNYCVSLGDCEDVDVRDVTIREALSDGIDPDSCRRVRIVNCDIESDDDAICIKASLAFGRPRPTEDIHVTRCRTRSGTNGFKIGTETSGSVRRVLVDHCDFDARPRAGRDDRAADLHDLHEAGGVSIHSVDGSDVEEVTIEHVRLEHTRGPISIRRGARGRGQDVSRPGVLRDIVLRDIEATSARAPSSIAGLPGFPVERVTFERVHVDAIGGGSRDRAPVPELPDAYPQNTMFGNLPAWGLYARHVRGLVLGGVVFRARAADARKRIVLEDVDDFSES